MRPDWACQQHHGAKCDSRLRRSHRQPIPFRFALQQISNAADEGHKKREKRRHPARGVQVKDPLHQPHRLFRGRDIKRGIRRNANQSANGQRRYSDSGHRSASRTAPWLVKRNILTPPEDIRRKAILPSKTPRQTRPESPPSPIAARASRQKAPLSLPCSRSEAASARAAARAAASVRAYALARRPRRAPCRSPPARSSREKARKPIAARRPATERCTGP